MRTFIVTQYGKAQRSIEVEAETKEEASDIAADSFSSSDWEVDGVEDEWVD